MANASGDPEEIADRPSEQQPPPASPLVPPAPQTWAPQRAPASPPPWAPQQKPPAAPRIPQPPVDLRPTSRSAMAVAAGLIVLALLAGLVIVLPAGSGGGGGGGDPEATVQLWAAAMQNGDYARADTYLSDDLRSFGGSSQFLVLCGRLSGVDVSNAFVSGSAATVSMTLRFQGGRSITWVTPMVLSNGVWKIDGNPSRISCY
jgi:hypothetical protein